MKRFLLRRLLPLSLACLLTAAFLRLSDNTLMPPAQPEEKPYYVPEDASVAELGGLGLSYAEFRYHAWQALTQDLGRKPGEVDLFYDETLAEQVRELAVLRAARWRAAFLLAMREGIEVPEPEESLVETLCRESFVTPGVAEGLLRYERLTSLLYLREYGPEGSLLSGEEILAWGSANGVVRLRALWLSANPEIYSQTEIEGRVEQAEIFAAQLNRGEAAFDDFATLTERTGGGGLESRSPPAERMRTCMPRARLWIRGNARSSGWRTGYTSFCAARWRRTS